MEATLSRKMRSLPIIFLSVTSALAANYARPIDYFDDDFHQNVKVGPGSTFSFNFEQTRRDQPPQVEMREENVGRYFQARPQTTTPASIFSMKADKESQHAYPTMMANNDNYQQGHWNQPQPASVPPPPKFAFSRAQNNQAKPQMNTVPAWNTPTVHQNAYPTNTFNQFPPQSPNTPVPQWTGPPKTQSTPSSQTAFSHTKDVENIRFSPSASYVSDSITNKNPRQPPSPPSRGNHKFSWDDIKNENPMVHNHHAQTPNAPSSIYNKPPSPVPTLSPWYDNFGK